MRLLSRLDDERKSGAIWYAIFQKSPKNVINIFFYPRAPHGSPSWQRGYNRRNALQRSNNRIDNSFGFERYFIRGLAKMQTRVGLALAVMMAMAMALGHVRQGRVAQMRSLVQPIPFPVTG
jgi:hypothetical protein